MPSSSHCIPTQPSSKSHQFCLPNALSHITLPTTITLVQATSISHPDPCKIFLRVLSAFWQCPTWKTKWTLTQKTNFIPLLTPCSDTSLHSKQNADFSHDQQGHGWLMCPVQLRPGAYFLLTTKILWHWTHWFHRCTDSFLSHGSPSALGSFLLTPSLDGLLPCLSFLSSLLTVAKSKWYPSDMFFFHVFLEYNCFTVLC